MAVSYWSMSALMWKGDEIRVTGINMLIGVPSGPILHKWQSHNAFDECHVGMPLLDVWVDLDSTLVLQQNPRNHRPF
jgi:hypothetical protein